MTVDSQRAANSPAMKKGPNSERNYPCFRKCCFNLKAVCGESPVRTHSARLTHDPPSSILGHDPPLRYHRLITQQYLSLFWVVTCFRYEGKTGNSLIRLFLKISL